MSTLPQGSSGVAVQTLQEQLIALGLLAGAADGVFGAQTALAVRDAQRRRLLRPDGLVGPLTAAALAQARRRQPSVPISPYRALVEQATALAACGEASEETLPHLDRGLAGTPSEGQPAAYAARLAVAASASPPGLPEPDRFGPGLPYPAHGVVPPIVSGRDGRGGLEFLSEEVSQACLCIGRFSAGRPLRVRWYGRRALEDNVQFWSATKFIAPLHLICQVNRRRPGLAIGSTRVRSLDGSHSESFSALLRDMISYAPRSGESDGGGSNRIAYLFKRLRQSGEPDLQSWHRQLAGNPRALLLGWYGQWEPPRDRPDPSFRNPYRQGAELVGPEGVLLGHAPLPRSRNLVSAYDLVRMLSLLGWHPLLSPEQRLPGAQWSSLATLVEALGHDTARYVDAALEQLGLGGALAEPVILSKMGYGAETGDAAIDALTYVAFVSGWDQRVRPARRRSFCFALRIPTAPGLSTALRHDARMAAEVCEIVRRVFAEELG